MIVTNHMTALCNPKRHRRARTGTGEKVKMASRAVDELPEVELWTSCRHIGHGEEKARNEFASERWADATRAEARDDELALVLEVQGWNRSLGGST